MVEKGSGDWFPSSTFLPSIPFFAPLLLKFCLNGDSDDVKVVTTTVTTTTLSLGSI